MPKKSAKSGDKPGNSTLRTLHYYWQEAVRYKWYCIGLFISTPVVIFIRGFLVAYIFADIIEKVGGGTIPADQVFSALLPEAIGLVAAYLLSSVVLEKLRLWACWKLELKAAQDLSLLAFQTLSTQTMQFHNDRFGGSLVSQASRFAGSFERLFDTIVWSLLPLVCAIVFTVVILWPLAPIFVICLLVFVVTYAVISFFSFKRIAHLNYLEAEAATKQSGTLADSVTNILSVKSYGREAYEQKRYSRAAQKTYTAGMVSMRSVIRRDIAFSTVYVGIIAALVVFLIGGPTWFGLSISTLILIVTYSQQIMNNLWDINNIFRNFNRAFGDASDMTQILDTPDLVHDADGAKPLEATEGAVSFNSITFRHADSTFDIFRDFNLDIAPGERIGLVGVSGSGKTTLTKLLLRFADVSEGSIDIDGQNIAEVQQVSLRENIAYVPQETTLFHRSIAENIAYGRPDAKPEEIERAAILANAHEFIAQLPKGYDTLVGERGVKLSGGQRQRVAIARAILKDAPILVLDEATSALDSESEALIQDALVKLMNGRTSIVIAHRLSTVASLDRIVVLKDGKIIEQGSHADLVAKSGEYAKLWDRQTGAFAAASDD
jgi:ATP-binding cassette subfamily B protein